MPQEILNGKDVTDEFLKAVPTKESTDEYGGVLLVKPTMTELQLAASKADIWVGAFAVTRLRIRAAEMGRKMMGFLIGKEHLAKKKHCVDVKRPVRTVDALFIPDHESETGGVWSHLDFRGLELYVGSRSQETSPVQCCGFICCVQEWPYSPTENDKALLQEMNDCIGANANIMLVVFAAKGEMPEPVRCYKIASGVEGQGDTYIMYLVSTWCRFPAQCECGCHWE